jgi:hypothetical protein
MTGGTLVSVIVDKKIQCWDIYVDGVWQGSRRTEKQCFAYIDWLISRAKEANV